MNKAKLFYSWQSDCPPANSKIREFLNKTVEECKKYDIDLYVDDATKDRFGSVDITKSIEDKIKSDDFFLADMTPISETINVKRPLCNPNVLFEAGLAFGYLGEERVFIAIVCDEDVNLPFDVEHRRSFRIRKKENIDADAKNLAASINSFLEAGELNKPKTIGKHDMCVLERIKKTMDYFHSSYTYIYSTENELVAVDSDGNSVIDKYRSLMYELELPGLKFVDKSLQVLEKQLHIALQTCVAEMCSNMNNYGECRHLMSLRHYLDEHKYAYMEPSERERLPEYKIAEEQQAKINDARKQLFDAYTRLIERANFLANIY